MFTCLIFTHRQVSHRNKNWFFSLWTTAWKTYNTVFITVFSPDFVPLRQHSWKISFFYILFEIYCAWCCYRCAYGVYMCTLLMVIDANWLFILINLLERLKCLWLYDARQHLNSLDNGKKSRRQRAFNCVFCAVNWYYYFIWLLFAACFK